MWRMLDGRGAPAHDAGGKAAALDRLIAADVRVPPAAVLTVAAYRTFVRDARLEPFLRSLSASVPPQRIHEDEQRVERAFLDAPLPGSVGDAIAAAFDQVARGGRVAVRSSATAEDLADASFAGQYRSLLGVGADEVERAVRLCWASLWSPAVRAYRRAQELDPANVTMAVILQQMIDAEQSGVAFTMDPTSGDTRALRIEVVEGAGEGLVSGDLTPEVFRVDRADRSVDPGAPAFLSELARVAIDIERLFGTPQDIEWSVTGGVLHILQARPVTPGAVASDGFDTEAGEHATFIPAGVAEMLPGVLPPLIWTTNAPMVEEAFTSLYSQLGIRLPPDGGSMVARFRGRAALNLTTLKLAARGMPGGSGAEVERQYLGRVVSEDVEPRDRGLERARRATRALRALRLRRRLLKDADAFIEATDLALSLQPVHAELETSVLLSYRRRIRDLARFGMRTEVGVAASAAANYRALEMALERWLGEAGAALDAQRLTAGSVGEKPAGCEAVLAVFDAEEGSGLPREVIEAIFDGRPEETEQRLEGIGGPGREFLDVVRGGLARAGCQSIYAGRTWDEDVDAFWRALRGCSVSRGDRGRRPPPSPLRALREVEDRVARTWRWRITRVLTGQVVDVRKRLLHRMVSDAGDFLRARESVKAAVLRLGGEERRVVRELARRLRARGVLEREDDVLFVASEELDALVEGASEPSRAVLRARRTAFEAMREAPPLPEVFVGAPSAEGEELHELSGNVLHGWATSPGRATGRARVVHELADASDLSEGDILVGRSTDPSWTPLFLAAGGIVMEEGGPLSHAAIVAREFGLPAVLSAKGATRRIRTGTELTVDGAAGTVEILDEDAVERSA